MPPRRGAAGRGAAGAGGESRVSDRRDEAQGRGGRAPSSERRRRAGGYALVALAACLWALIGPVARFAFAAGMDPLEVSFWRAALGWVLFAGQALATRRTAVRARDLPTVVAFGVVGVAGLFGFNTLAVDHGGAALASVLLYTAPAWVALLAWLLRYERLTGGKLAAVALTLAGVWGVAEGGAAEARAVTPAALGFGLAAGFSYALFYVFGKRYEGRYATPTLFLYALPAAALVLLPFLDRARLGDHPPQAWVAVGVIVVASTFLSYTVYYAGLRRLEATRAAVVATLEPVVAAALAGAVWGEAFGPLGYVGAALILSAVLLSVLGGRRPGRAGR